LFCFVFSLNVRSKKQNNRNIVRRNTRVRGKRLCNVFCRRLGYLLETHTHHIVFRRGTYVHDARYSGFLAYVSIFFLYIRRRRPTTTTTIDDDAKTHAAQRERYKQTRTRSADVLHNKTFGAVLVIVVVVVGGGGGTWSTTRDELIKNDYGSS